MRIQVMGDILNNTQRSYLESGASLWNIFLYDISTHPNTPDDNYSIKKCPFTG